MSRPDLRQAWEDENVVESYTRGSTLFPAELAVFADAWTTIRGGRVLDIGVGAGRTLPYLRGPAQRYLAIDFSQGMVDACKRRFPDAEVARGDARDLAEVADESFDFAFFSFNSIDCIRPEERRNVLASVRRVLRPDGLFGFSTHNLRTAPPIPSRISLPEIRWSKSPVRVGKQLVRAARDTAEGVRNQRRLRHQEHRADGYALVNDGTHNFAMLFVYADPSWQVAELERAGFADVKVYDADGRVADPATVADPWPHFLARRL